MNFKIFLPYLLVMAIVTYLIRVIPLVLVKHKIKNKFFNSFLYYIPYTVLAAMTYISGDFDCDRKPYLGDCTTGCCYCACLSEKKSDSGSGRSLCSSVYYRRNHNLDLNPDLPQAK